jgi:hypothetical protein
MLEMKAKKTRPRNAVTGEHITAASGGGREAALIREDRSYGYYLGSLEVARAGFIAATNLPINWIDAA